MKPAWRTYLLWGLIVLSLAVIVLYAIARFTAVPYTGFTITAGSGEINTLQVDNSALQIKDRVLQVGEVPWEIYTADRSRPLFAEFASGQAIHLLVQRGEEEIPVTWHMPALNLAMFLDRLINAWLVAPIFWVFGLLTLLRIRPRDNRWALLIAFYALLTMWLMIGGTSQYRVWYSSLLYRAITWPMLAVAWHFHWEFPASLGRLPKRLLLAGYGLAGLLTVAEAAQLLPEMLYVIGTLLVLVGSIVLLGMHFVRQPASRPAVRLLALALIVVLLLVMTLGWLSELMRAPAVAYLFFPAIAMIPLTYYDITARRRPGGMEVRDNPLMVYVYFALGFVWLALAGMGAVVLLTSDPTTELLLTGLWVVVMGLAGIPVFPYFRRWFERAVLKIHIPSDELVAAHARLLSTSTDRAQLSAALVEKIFPSLLIRQAAVLELIDANEHFLPRRLNPVALLGVSAAELPAPALIPQFLSPDGQTQSPLSWVQLAVPLIHHSRPIGVCLLGRRDPDDAYSADEIPVLQTLMAQTALSLVNTDQAELIHVLQRHQIDRREHYIQRLAHELHDGVLGQMGLIARQIDPNNAEGQLIQQQAADRVRDIISGLRPVTLAYSGLSAALEELLDELQTGAEAQGQPNLKITLTVEPAQTRYPAEVELALFRIVQQAGANAIQHAQARNLTLAGTLTDKRIELIIADDGTGFEAFARSELTLMLLNKHFGLSTMYERADLINARLEITSTPNQGSCVKVVWEG